MGEGPEKFAHCSDELGLAVEGSSVSPRSQAWSALHLCCRVFDDSKICRKTSKCPTCLETVRSTKEQSRFARQFLTYGCAYMEARHKCRRICSDLYAIAEALVSSFMPTASWLCGVFVAVQGEFLRATGSDGSADMLRNISAPLKSTQG